SKTPRLIAIKLVSIGNACHWRRFRRHRGTMNSGQLAVEQLLAKAKMASNRQDYAQAGAIYRTLLEREPDLPDALFGLGIVELQDGRFAAAYALLERTLAALEQHDTPAQMLAVVTARLGLAAFHLCNVSLAL